MSSNWFDQLRGYDSSPILRLETAEIPNPEGDMYYLYWMLLPFKTYLEQLFYETPLSLKYLVSKVKIPRDRTYSPQSIYHEVKSAVVAHFGLPDNFDQFQTPVMLDGERAEFGHVLSLQSYLAFIATILDWETDGRKQNVPSSLRIPGILKELAFDNLIRTFEDSYYKDLHHNQYTPRFPHLCRTIHCFLPIESDKHLVHHVKPLKKNITIGTTLGLEKELEEVVRQLEREGVRLDLAAIRENQNYLSIIEEDDPHAALKEMLHIIYRLLSASKEYGLPLVWDKIRQYGG